MLERHTRNEQLQAEAPQPVFLNRLVDTIERGIGEGEIKPDTDAQAFAMLLFSSLEGALVVSRLEGSYKPLEVVAVTLEKYLDERNAIANDSLRRPIAVCRLEAVTSV